MKLVLEVVLSVIFHPVAVVLAWINIFRRRDLSPPLKGLWLVITLIWGLGPLLYISVGGGTLW